MARGRQPFVALRTGFSLELFCRTASNKIMNVWHVQMYYNS